MSSRRQLSYSISFPSASYSRSHKSIIKINISSFFLSRVSTLKKLIHKQLMLSRLPTNLSKHVERQSRWRSFHKKIWQKSMKKSSLRNVPKKTWKLSFFCSSLFWLISTRQTRIVFQLKISIFFSPRSRRTHTSESRARDVLERTHPRATRHEQWMDEGMTDTLSEFVFVRNSHTNNRAD